MKVTKKACFSVCLALKTGSHEGHQFEDPFHFEDPFRMKFLFFLICFHTEMGCLS